MAARAQQERDRDVLSREVGYIRKNRTEAGSASALAFPNTYFVGMSNLGFQTVYRLFNELDDVVCERVFLPAEQELAAQLASGSRCARSSPTRRSATSTCSRSRSRSSGTTPTSCRCCGSPACPCAPRRGPTRSARGDRRRRDVREPEPLAPFADVIAAGEGEVLDPALMRALGDADDRHDLYQRLAAERGMYIPSFYDVRYAADGTIAAFDPKPGTGAPPVVKKAAVKSTDHLDPPATMIFTPDTEFGSRFLIEVVRGCANLCRFCWAGYNYLPVRPFPADRILELARAARTHANRVGLVSIALCDHPEIDRILSGLMEMGYSISPASLRLDDLTDSIVAKLHASGERSITIRARDRLRPPAPRDQQDRDQRRDPREDGSDLRERHRQPEALLHDRPPDGKRRGPGVDPRADRADARHHDGPRPARRGTSGGSSPASTRSSRSPAPPTSGCPWRIRRSPIARASGCARSSPISTTSTSTSSRSGTPTNRR
jgi:hypothetical protein